MASQGATTTLVYMAYNGSTGVYVTGDVANHTLKLVKDGTAATPTNSPAEVDATNAPGAYKLALTSAETSFNTVWLGGKSSTANVILIPITATFELLPTATPGTSGGVFIAGSNAATTVNITGNVTGNLSGSVGSVTGAVGSVTAQVTANTTSWAGVTTAVDANNLPKVDIEAINGATVAAAELALSTQSICSGTIGVGSTTTSFVTSALANPSSLTDTGQLIGRTIIFLGIAGNSGHVQAQATNITSSTTGSTPTIGSTNALTTAPANGDKFVVL